MISGAADLRYLSEKEYRVLAGASFIYYYEGGQTQIFSQVEIGSKKHEIVPSSILARIVRLDRKSVV